MSTKFAERYGIWALAFGYFAAYVPYSALTKAMSKGILPGMAEPVPGLELLPITVVASMFGMFAFLTWKGWWKYAAHSTVFGIRIPHPTLWTFLSGLGTAAVVATTTLAYTFEGVSIVFMMLLMRGGVLVIAPIVDTISGRHVRWFSWVALALSFAALFVTFSGDGGFVLSVAAAIDVAIYLTAYFVRLRFMSRLAKSSDENANLRYFVEEQMVGTPALLVFLAVLALIGGTETNLTIRAGFTSFLSSELLPVGIAIGLLSQGTGIFGGLILLDKRENTFCVPVNRSSSILAGLVATFCLWAILDEPFPPATEFVGAALVIAAILFLSLPPLMEKRRQERAAAEKAAAGELHPSA